MSRSDSPGKNKVVKTKGEKSRKHRVLLVKSVNLGQPVVVIKEQVSGDDIRWGY